MQSNDTHKLPSSFPKIILTFVRTVPAVWRNLIENVKWRSDIFTSPQQNRCVLPRIRVERNRLSQHVSKLPVRSTPLMKFCYVRRATKLEADKNLHATTTCSSDYRPIPILILVSSPDSRICDQILKILFGKLNLSIKSVCCFLLFFSLIRIKCGVKLFSGKIRKICCTRFKFIQFYSKLLKLCYVTQAMKLEVGR